MKNNASFSILRAPARIGACLLATTLLACPTLADDKKASPTANKDASAPDAAEMMKKYAEMAAPTAEHKLLASLAGEWEAEVKCHMTGYSNPGSKGTANSKMILGGRFLQEHFEGDMMGQKFKGISLTGYDKSKKMFVATWADDMGTAIFVSEGKADANGKVITMEGKMDDLMTGEKDKKVRTITKILGPDKHTFEMHDLSLGAESKVMEITYVRKGKASSTALSAK